MNKKYIGHPSQICGAMQFRLEGGKSEGMRMLRVYNSTGLEFFVSLDYGKCQRQQYGVYCTLRTCWFKIL